MAGMKRFVTYIYQYEDGKKGSNTGFAKIEVRGEECRIEVHLRGTYMNHAACKVYLFKEDAGDILGFTAGEMKIASGAGDFGTAIRAEQIGGSSFGMNDMEGIAVISEDNRIFLSRWSEGPAITVNAEHLRIWEPTVEKVKAIIKESRKQTAQTRNNMGNTSFREGSVAAGNSVVGNRAAGNSVVGNRAAEKNVAGKSVVENSVLKENTAALKDIIPSKTEVRTEETAEVHDIPEEEDVMATEIPMRNIFPKYRWKEIWEALQQNHMLLAPFESEDAVCVRVELKDLRELPKCYWYLGNNSFLLHGFFNYRYLVIGKTEEERWFIGVPGIYQNQERVMASIFGFPEFIPEALPKNLYAKEFPEMEAANFDRVGNWGEEPVNRFGYWFRYIEE